MTFLFSYDIISTEDKSPHQKGDDKQNYKRTNKKGDDKNRTTKEPTKKNLLKKENLYYEGTIEKRFWNQRKQVPF